MKVFRNNPSPMFRPNAKYKCPRICEKNKNAPYPRPKRFTLSCNVALQELMKLRNDANRCRESGPECTLLGGDLSKANTPATSRRKQRFRGEIRRAFRPKGV